MKASFYLKVLRFEVLGELVGDGSHEGLVFAAAFSFLAEDAREATEQVVTSMKVGTVVCVADYALEDPQILLTPLWKQFFFFFWEYYCFSKNAIDMNVRKVAILEVFKSI